MNDTRGRTGEDEQPNRPLSGLAVDTTGDQDVVYVTWREQNRLADPNGEAVKPTMAVSTDGGASFGEPVHLSDGVFDEIRRTEALMTTTTTAPATTTTSAPTTPTTEAAAPTSPSSLPAAPAPSTTTTTAPPPGTNAAEPDAPGNFGGSNPVVAVDDEGAVYSIWVTAYDNLMPSPG
ncbi:MAG: hypothetical protein M3535_06395, partial [Actinomycetota bacterium]|nr:hypothetical protein [Actinomycetota bacterium]